MSVNKKAKIARIIIIALVWFLMVNFASAQNNEAERADPTYIQGQIDRMLYGLKNLNPYGFNFNGYNTEALYPAVNLNCSVDRIKNTRENDLGFYLERTFNIKYWSGDEGSLPPPSTIIKKLIWNTGEPPTFKIIDSGIYLYRVIGEGFWAGGYDNLKRLMFNFDTENDSYRFKLNFLLKNRSITDGGFKSNGSAQTILNTYCLELRNKARAFYEVIEALRIFDQKIKDIYATARAVKERLANLPNVDSENTQYSLRYLSNLIYEISNNNKEDPSSYGILTDEALSHVLNGAKPDLDSISHLAYSVLGIPYSNMNMIYLYNFSNIEAARERLRGANVLYGDTERKLEAYTKLSTFETGRTPNGVPVEDEYNRFKERKGRVFESIGFTLTAGKIELELESKPIAVLPPGIFGAPASPEGYRQTDPKKLIDIIQDFLLRFSEELFILLVVIGGLMYILGPFKPDNITKAHNWIKYAVIGYAIILVALAAVSLVKGLFG